MSGSDHFEFDPQRSARLLTLTATLFLLLLILLLPSFAHAQTPSSDITLEMTPLYGGSVKYGEWLPVEIAIENSGAAQSGILRIPNSTSGNVNYYGQRVELPAGARKVVTINTTVSNSARTLTAQWLPDGAKEPTVKVTADVDAVPNIRFMTATISSGGKGLDALSSMEFGDQRNRTVLVVPLALERLPDRAELLATIDMLVISGVDTSELTPAQQQALTDFVVRGGLLVLGGGPEAGRVLAGLPETLRPVTLAGEQSLDSLPALRDWGGGDEVRVNGPFPAAVATAAPDATVRLTQTQLPLVVERPLGNGAIFWTALDPALSPFDAWAGTGGFWQTMLGERTLFPVNRAADVSIRQMIQEQMDYTLQNVPALDLPSLRLMVPLILLYILLVGPITYLVLRAKRRLEWAWLTIPLATILFSVGTYGLGFRLRGSDIVINTVSIALAAPNSDQATVYGKSGLFSPATRSYTMAVPEEAMASISDSSNPWGPPPTAEFEDMTILQGDPTLLEPFTVPQWEMRAVGLESQWELGGNISSDLSLSDDKVVGTVTNSTVMALVDPALIMNGRFEMLETLEPGETVDISFDLSKTQDMMQGGDLGWQMFGNQGGGNLNRQQQIRLNLFNVVNNNNVMFERFGAPGLPASASPMLRNSSLTLIAWPEVIPTQPTLIPDNGTTALVGTTLLSVGLPLSFREGVISTPPGFISGAVESQESGSVCYTSYGIPSLMPDYRSAEIRWQLPTELTGIALNAMTIDIGYDYEDTDDPSVSVELYDPATESWEAVELGQFGRVEEGQRFLGADGSVRMKVTNQSINIGGCQLFDLRLRGRIGETP
ncbi:MAG: hypothetical protein KDD73_04170 [Anaerolineales bacterium]|nr:hypothetical protein [Anaerolineales bacterium]